MLRIILILPLISSTLLFGQTSTIKIDSLLIQLEHSDEIKQKVEALWNLSDYYWADDIRKSYDYSQEALTLSKEANDKELIGNSYNKLADALLFLGNYDESLENYLQGLEILEQLDNPSALFPLYHNMGVLQFRMNENDKALEYYHKALYIHNNYKVNGKPVGEGRTHTLYNSIANIYEQKSEEEQAKEYYHKALDEAMVLNDHQNLGVIYNNLSMIYIKTKLYEEARNFLDKSLWHRKQINDINGMAKSYNYYTNYYLALDSLDKALTASQKAIELASKAGAKHTEENALQLLSDIYEKKGEFKKSLETYKLYKSLSDTLINEKSIRKQTELQITYEYEKQKKIEEAEQQKKELRYSLIISVLALVSIISVLFFSLARSRHKRIKLQKESLEKDLELRQQDILAKDKELASSILYLLKKNELLTNISERLLNLKKRMKEENKNLIQKIIFDLQDGANEDVWKEFEYRFEQVHEDYYKKLKEHAPDLTPGEIKICTFLKLNMSSKEISAITHQSVKSIEVARTRIRKKLNLTNTDVNLVTFLLEL